MSDQKPRWAWSSVDDPNPYYPKCDRCEAFARWSIGEFEQPTTRSDLNPIIRYFACGRHMSTVLVGADWDTDALMVYDMTVPSERS